MELKNYTIKDIESMSAADLASFAEDVETIKGHTVYYIDFGGYFGFSACVTADGQHIKYANDYELHHSGKSRDELREIYRRELSEKLFTESELSTVSSYEDAQRKRYFLMNYYGERRPHVSVFYIGESPDVSGLTFSPVFMAYYKDSAFAKHGAELLHTLSEAEQKNADNFDYWRGAFLYEMYNHEYGINWQADYDVISCFGNCSSVEDYTDAGKLFSAAGFNEIQKAAYMAARREYYNRERGNL